MYQIYQCVMRALLNIFCSCWSNTVYTSLSLWTFFSLLFFSFCDLNILWLMQQRIVSIFNFIIILWLLILPFLAWIQNYKYTDCQTNTVCHDCLFRSSGDTAQEHVCPCLLYLINILVLVSLPRVVLFKNQNIIFEFNFTSRSSSSWFLRSRIMTNYFINMNIVFWYRQGFHWLCCCWICFTKYASQIHMLDDFEVGDVQ